MLRNYLKVAFRNILRQKFYSFINVAGLSIGIAATLLILLYVGDELSFDRFHERSEDIYRVYLKGRLNDQEFFGYASCNPLGSASVEEIPEVEASCRLTVWTEILVKYEEMAFSEPYLMLADSNFFDFFNFKLIEGNPKEALREPNSIVLTESLARKYFDYQGNGDTGPIGKMMNIGTGTWSHKVTGIVEDPPQNTHLKFNLLMSLYSWDQVKRMQWTSNNLATYLMLNPESNFRDTEQKIGQLVEKYVGPEIQQFLGISIQEFAEQGGAYGYFLTPLVDLHLKADAPEMIMDSTFGDIAYVYLLSAIALMIMVIACINFMNLSTARSAERAKEVGIRKTIGASRQLLIFQFLAESIIFSLIALVFAVGIVYLVIPGFNQISGKSLDFISMFSPVLMIGMFVIIIFVGFLAGSYPAFYLTSFSPAGVLRGKVKKGTRSKGIRSGLVIFQFTISIILIICTLLVYRQIDHLQNINLGFQKENIFILDNARSLNESKRSFIDELTAFEEIEGGFIINNKLPGVGSNSVYRPVGAGMEDIMLNYYYTDHDFQKTLGNKMVAGRYFSRDFPSDSSAVVINEAAATMLGWDDPLGEQIMEFGETADDAAYYEIIGVISDFNYESLRTDIKPMALFLANWGNYIVLKLNTDDIRSTIGLIQSEWKEKVPGTPFEFSFMDQNFDRVYQAEQRLGTIFMIFTFLAVLVASMGLFGLATFTAEQRSKEIGIRKAMGSSVSRIILLLSKDYITLVIIAFVISVPVSWYIMAQWLQNFAYRIEMGLLTFITAGMGAVFVAWLTVSYQSFKAARANPVDSLRYE